MFSAFQFKNLYLANCLKSKAETFSEKHEPAVLIT